MNLRNRIQNKITRHLQAMIFYYVYVCQMVEREFQNIRNHKCFVIVPVSSLISEKLVDVDFDNSRYISLIVKDE